MNRRAASSRVLPRSPGPAPAKHLPVVVLAVSVLGCIDPSAPRRTEASAGNTVAGMSPSAAGLARASQALNDPKRFDCRVDTDCLNSCMHGAVNASWYRVAEQLANFPECKDGCANQTSAPPRCQEGGCVAYQSDPRDERVVTKREDCTTRGSNESPRLP